MSVARVGAGIAAVGAISSAKGAKSAADAQAAGAAQADATQRYQFDETNRLNAPFRNAGVAGINELQYRLGLNPNRGGSTGSSNLLTREQLLAQLTPQFTSTVTDPKLDGYGSYVYNRNDERLGRDETRRQYVPATGSKKIDTAGLNAAIEKRLAQQQSQQQALQRTATQSAAQDDTFGSLLRDYDKSAADNDYIYQTQKQFGLDEGTKALNRIAAARGGLLSGAQTKALTRFGNDYAGTKLGESYNRYENNKTGTYNKLAGISGIGQNATNQVAAAGQNMANNISANQIGVGNARGASSIAQGNALSNGLSSGFNSYQQSQLLNRPASNGYDWAGQGGFGDSYSTSYGE